MPSIPGLRHGAEGGQEHGAFESLVAAVGDAPHRGWMSPMSWLLVPGRHRRPSGLRCLEVLAQAATGLQDGVVRPARAPAPARGWGGSG